MRRSTGYIVLVIFFITLLIPAIACAQGTGGTGAMQGHVTDRYGNPIEGANVTINSGHFQDPTQWMVTDDSGMYLFSNINLNNSNIWRVTVVVEYPGKPDYDARSEYKMVYDGQLVTNNLQFLSYPPSGRGSLYGVLTSGPGLDSPWYGGVVFITPMDYPGVTLFSYVDNFPNGEPAYFNLDHMPVGIYTVRGQHNTLNNQTIYSESITGVEISEDKNSFLQIYVPYSPIATIEYPQVMDNGVRGYITCDDGETPIINVNVSLQKSTTASFYTQVEMEYTDDNGYYNISGISVEGIRETFRLVMTYEIENQTLGWTSPDFYLYNEYSYGDNVNHVQVFDRSLDVNLTGYVEFDSNPQDAMVYINDVFSGYTPSTINLAEGSYSYVLVLQNHTNATGTFTITRYQTTELNISMAVVIPTTIVTTAPTTTGSPLFTVGIIAIVLIIVVVSLILFYNLRKRRSWQAYPGYHQQPPGGYYPGGDPGEYYGPPVMQPYGPQQGYQGYDRGHYNIQPQNQPPQPVQGYLPEGQGAPPALYPAEHPDAYIGHAERRTSYQMKESRPIHEVGQGFTPKELDYVLRFITQNPGGVSFVQMSRDLDMPMNVLTLITKELVINGLVEKEKGNYYPKQQAEQVDSSSVMVWRDDY